MPLPPRDLDEDELDDLDDEDDFDDEDDDDEDDQDLDDEDDDNDEEPEEETMTTVPRLNFTMTSESISVVGDTGRVYNIQKGAPNYAVVRQAIEQSVRERETAEQYDSRSAEAEGARVREAACWATVRGSLEVRQSVQTWANGRFTFNPAGTALLFDGREVPETISRRALAMIAKGDTPTPLFNFYERLSKNPSFRSVQQLFSFLEHMGIPLLPDGRFLAYKGVNMDFTDCHSGTFVNKPGAVHRMPRNEISDDPNTPCHVGFHVGALGYAQGFGPRVVVCRVDPENVVCVPYDYSAQKMRVCEYEVVGLYGQQQLPSDIYRDPLPVSKEVVGPTKEQMAGDEFDAFLDSPMLDKLLALDMDVLRDRAVNKYKIIGAGHIQGGKAVLIAVIMEAIVGQGKKTE